MEVLLKSQVCASDAQWGPYILNIRVWKRERFIIDSYKKMGGSYPRTPKLLKAVSKSL